MQILEEGDALLREAASVLIEHLDTQTTLNLHVIDRVAGLTPNCQKLAIVLSREIGRKRGRVCAWFAPDNAQPRVHGLFKELETVLHCAETLTDTPDILDAFKVVVAQKAINLPVVLTLFNTRGESEIGSTDIISFTRA